MLMDFTVVIDSPARIAALHRALDAFNASSAIALSKEQFVQRMIDGPVDGLVAAYVATRLTKLAFLNRFTADERIAIRAAAAQSPAIADYLAMLDAAQDVDLTDARTVGGAAALEAAGLIGAGRAAEILAL
jgi:hypothetical protein